jgi:hypothetical protein
VSVRLGRGILRLPLAGGEDELAGEGLGSGLERGHVDAGREIAQVEVRDAGRVECERAHCSARDVPHRQCVSLTHCKGASDSDDHSAGGVGGEGEVGQLGRGSPDSIAWRRIHATEPDVIEAQSAHGERNAILTVSPSHASSDTE